MTRFVVLVTVGVAVAGWQPALAATTAPVQVEQPGTQPTEVNGATSPGNCDTCHGKTTNPDLEPAHGWYGSMMSHALRDGLFWAALGVAEQDFLPGSDPATRGGVGDLCLRCHGPDGWLQGFATPTDGSGFAGHEEDGVECEICHLLVNPDEAVSVVGTTEVENAPYLAYDAASGDGYYGSAQMVLNGNGTRLGPYADAHANHPFIQSPFHRSAELCGTCHDVSNPAVGDLAHNNGAMVALSAGTFGGTQPGDTAAFNNPPWAYGVVERTFSEWTASALDTTAVNDYPALPVEMRVAGGILDTAYHRAYDARSDADYEDGTPRTFTCQTCHMSAGTGLGCNKNGVPERTDLPRHDLTGGAYWSPDLILYQADHGTLRVGSLTTEQRSALADARARAEAMLHGAASLAAHQDGAALQVDVVNLTGHKLISGYPEGRRMWLQVVFRDSAGAVVGERGGYGQIGRTVDDAAGLPHQVESLVDPQTTTLFEAEPGIDREWAVQLLGLGYPSGLVLAYDRLTDAPLLTLGELAGAPAGSAERTFHFVLNNVVVHDTRIPPYGFAYDEALARSALPVPASQYGDPGPGGTYEHHAEVGYAIPAAAVSAEVRLLYQQTSWEYVQFVWLANDGLSAFLGTTGADLLDAWLNTGMSTPFEMATAGVAVISPSSEIFSDDFEGGGTGEWSASIGEVPP